MHLKYLIYFVITNGYSFSYQATDILALNHVRVSVPSAVLRGHSATLRCHFDLEGDILYSVKWYKGGREFYRYTPRETPPSKMFPVPGLSSQLQVEMSKSNATHLTLKDVTPAISGKYSCEVSADAPSFQTALFTGHMNVVTAPRHSPSLLGLRARYRVGDTLRANCTSADSRPAANLSWLLNGHQVDRRYVKVYDVVRENEDDLETSSSILEKILVAQDFNSNSRLKIRCTASIMNVYWQTTEKSVEWERPRGHHHEDYQSRPTVQLNLKNDVESVSIMREDEPPQVTSPGRSRGSSAQLQPLCWRLLLFQLSFALT